MIKPQHKAPNERWARKIIYKDVIRRNNAIPEAGTTIQQSRSQYDPNLDENLLNKLNKKLDLNHGAKWSLRFAHNRKNQVEESESNASDKKKVGKRFKPRPIQVMPSLRKTYEKHKLARQEE